MKATKCRRGTFGCRARSTALVAAVVASFMLLQACAAGAGIARDQDAGGQAGQEISAGDQSTVTDPEPLAAATNEKKPDEILSPEAKRNIALCLLTGPLCGAFLLYVGAYAATAAAICTPVAAITTPMGNNSFQEELLYCMKNPK